MITGEQRLKMCTKIQRQIDDGMVGGWERLTEWWKTPNKLLNGAIPEKLKEAGPDGEDELYRLVMAGRLP